MRILFLETCQQSRTSAWYYSAGRKLSMVRGPNILKKDLCYYHYYSIIIIVVATDNDDEIVKTFGAAPKKFSNPAPLFPSFNAVQGTTYFTDALKRINGMKVFTIPSWMPKLKKPNIPFNLPPSS